MEQYQLMNNHDVIAFGDYYEGKKYADEHNLKEAEYGDVYGSKLSYCYFNKTGNRYDDEDVIIYYRFGRDGKPQPISDEELRNYLFN